MHLAKTRCLGSTCALLLAMALPTSADAALVTYSFSGTVTGFNPSPSPLSPTFAIGNTLSGTYTVESTTTALPGGTSVSAVYNALTTMSFTLGSYSASSLAAAEIEIGNDNGTDETTDRYATRSRAGAGLTGAQVNGLSLLTFSLRMEQDEGTLFGPADAFLPTAIELADFDGGGFFLDFTGGDESLTYRVFGDLTELAPVVAPVPEPATLALLGVGLAGLAAVRRRRRACPDNV